MAQEINFGGASSVVFGAGEFVSDNKLFLTPEEAKRYAWMEADFISDIIDYKFNEPELIEELQKYVDTTYGQHYGKSKIQTTEFIVDLGHGTGFCVGNAIKYLQRYGKKEGFNRKDILKALHYILILLHTHDLEHSDSDETQ